MSGEIKVCTDCVHRFTSPHNAKHSRCRQSGEPEAADASLCGEMRKPGGKCGPDATLHEVA